MQSINIHVKITIKLIEAVINIRKKVIAFFFQIFIYIASQIFGFNMQICVCFIKHLNIQTFIYAMVTFKYSNNIHSFLKYINHELPLSKFLYEI